MIFLKHAEKKILGMILLKAFIATMVYLYYDSMLAVGTTFKSSVIVTRAPPGTEYVEYQEPRDVVTNTDQQWSPVCSNIKQSYLNKTSETWVPVSDDKVSAYIYSAYLINEKAGHNTVVIVGAQTDRTGYTCQLWYWNNRSQSLSIKEEVAVHTVMLPESHGLRYSVRLFHCRLSTKDVPLYVSIVTASCNAPKHMLSVERIDVRIQNYRKFTVCLSPLNSMYSRAYELIEWIELNRILGAERIVVYNNSIADNVAKVLKYYSQLGITEVVNWQVPMGTDIHYFGQVAALNDCLYRNKNKSEFIVNLDLDEFIVPHLDQTNNWEQLLEHLGSNYDAYLFRSTFFRKYPGDATPSSVDNSLVNKYKLITLKELEHEEYFYFHRMRSKYISRTDTVFEVMIHEVRMARNVASVSKDEAFVHHYRNLDIAQEKPDKMVADRTILDKYGKTLINNVEAVWSNLHDVPMDKEQ